VIEAKENEMTEKIITMEIDEAGNSSVDLIGFQGQGCGDVAKDFRGDDDITRLGKKREYYKQAETGITLRKKA
jgi:hypothetical protein